MMRGPISIRLLRQLEGWRGLAKRRSVDICAVERDSCGIGLMYLLRLIG